MIEILIVAGMSGAGRSTVSAALEDLAWSVIDNLPLELISRVSELAASGSPELPGVAFIVGRGGVVNGEHLIEVLNQLNESGFRSRLLFLDAPDDVLVHRFEGTRRRHPIPTTSVAEAIVMERQLLHAVRDRADMVIETGSLNSNQLRTRIADAFRSHESGHLKIALSSFGYSRGIPRDADLVFDCRFLPNPHWIEALRPYTGLQPAVAEHVLSNDDAVHFVNDVVNLLSWQIPAFAKEGKSYLSIAIGCTGGKHRSVAIAEEIAKRLEVPVSVFHRDIELS